jgi:hypothetical protein
MHRASIINEAPSAVDNAVLSVPTAPQMAAMTVCGKGVENIPISIELKNDSQNPAYITSIGGGSDKHLWAFAPIRNNFNVTVNGSPSFGTDKSNKTYPMIPANGKAVLNTFIRVSDTKSILDQIIKNNPQVKTSKSQVEDFYKTVRSIPMSIGYNNANPLRFNITTGGFTVNETMGCSSTVTQLPKGF